MNVVKVPVETEYQITISESELRFLHTLLLDNENERSYMAPAREFFGCLKLALGKVGGI